MKIALVDLGPSRPELHEPLGIETLAGYLNAKCKFDAVVDLFSASFQAISYDILRSYDIVGISAKLGTWNRLKDICDFLGCSKNKPIVIIGDLLASYAYREVLKNFKDVICVRGPGEKPLLQLIHRICEMRNTESLEDLNRHLEDVCNIAYIDENEIQVNDRSFCDLSDYAIPQRVFAASAVEANAQVQLEASRGCPWNNCSFCSIPSICGVKWQPIDIDRIITQLVSLSELGARSPYFTDADFLGTSLSRVKDFAARVIENKLSGSISSKLDYYVNLQVLGVIGGSKVLSESQSDEMLSLLKRSGLREIFVGLESGDPSQVRRYGKASTRSRNRAAILKLHEYGFQTDIGFIMFDPHTSIAGIENNLDFIRECDLWYHPSRLTKALRVQPETEYYYSLNKETDLEFDHNNLCYRYSFIDKGVSSVYQRFRSLERKFQWYCTLVQGTTKGEVSDEAARVSIRNYLGALRRLHLDYLRSCVIAFKNKELHSPQFGKYSCTVERDILELCLSQPKPVREQITRFEHLIVESSTDITYDRFNELSYLYSQIDHEPTI